MNQRRVIYLDLEDKRIRDIVNERFPNNTSFNIWSYAIYDDKDSDEFDYRLRPELEIAMRSKFDVVFDVDQIQKMVASYEGIKYDTRHEFMQLNNKFYSFIKYGQLCRNHHLILFDDTVPNMIMQIPDINVTIETIKI
jgi:hypothetical protein